jgi:hypothetical protein
MKMLKKVLLVVLCLMVASVSLAQTSGPSNVAGYVKTSTLFGAPGQAAATPFGLPFMFWDVVAGVPTYGTESTSPSDILGDQPAAGDAITADKIIRQDGVQAYRDNTGPIVWTGALEDDADMLPGYAYWYVNKTGAARDIVLAGEVVNEGSYAAITITDPPAAPPGLNFATSYSWRDSRNVPLEELGLLTAGFAGGDLITSDKLVEQVGGGIVNYDIGIPGWVGGFTETVPGRAYWLVNKHPGNLWVYDYDGSLVLPFHGNDDEGVITRTGTSTSTMKDNIRSTSSVRAPSKVSKEAPASAVSSHGGKTKDRSNK